MESKRKEECMDWASLAYYGIVLCIVVAAFAAIAVVITACVEHAIDHALCARDAINNL